jgi:outer membrane lipoprotein-sorting protein
MTAKALVVCVAAAAFAVAQSNNDQPSSARGQGQPPQPQATAEPGQPDALDLLRNVAETYRSMATLRAEANMVTEMNGPAMQQKIEMPLTLIIGSQGKTRIESKGAIGMLSVSDGQTTWMYMPQLNKYYKLEPAKLISLPKVAGQDVAMSGGAWDFRSQYASVAENAKQAKVLRSETLQASGSDVPCWVVYVEFERAGAEATPQAARGLPPMKVDPGTRTLWIDKAHYLVYQEISNAKMTLPGTSSPTETKHTVTFKDITVDEPVPDDTFAFTPPEGATEMDLSSFMPQSSPPNK